MIEPSSSPQAKFSLSLSYDSGSGGSNISSSQANPPPSLPPAPPLPFQPPSPKPPAEPPTAPTLRRRSRRGFCYSFFLWLTLVLIGLIFLAAIAGGVFYVLYRPPHPTFTVSSINLEQFNLTSCGSLTSRLDLAVTARNPNRKISFLYDPISIAVSSDGVAFGGRSFPAFVNDAKKTTVMKAAVSSKGSEIGFGGGGGAEEEERVAAGDRS